MEFLLFALFFIFTLIFFIAGKDDFGRKENKLIIKETENVKTDEDSKPNDEIKKDIEFETENVKTDEDSKPNDEIKKDIEFETENVKTDEDSKPNDEIKKDIEFESKE